LKIRSSAFAGKHIFLDYPFIHSFIHRIMTPYFDKSKLQPISPITCAALYDLGYKVNFGAADRAFGAADRAWEDDTNYNAIRADPMVVPSKSFVIDDEKIRRPKLLSL
jgi:hypothetical protein